MRRGTDFSSSSINGTGTFVQAGSGTTTLNVANGYTGGTAVNAGGLLITNTSGTSAIGTGALTVAANATFGGSGIATGLGKFSIAGTSTTALAKVIVGAGGTDTSTNLTLQATTGTINFANLTYNLDSAGNGNQLVLNNSGGTGTTLTLNNSTVTLNVVGGDLAPGTSYVLLSDASGLSLSGITTNGGSDAGNSTSDIITGGLTFATGSTVNTTGAYAGSYLYLTDNGTQIDVMVVPEPGTWALMVGGLATLVFWQRRKRNN